MGVKLDEKLRTMQRQAEDDSLNMISTVKFFSREDIHLAEQAESLDQQEHLSLKKNSYISLFSFIGDTSDIFSFAVSLLLLVHNFEEIAMDGGRREIEAVSSYLTIFSLKLHSLRSSNSFLPVILQDKPDLQLHIRGLHQAD